MSERAESLKELMSVYPEQHDKLLESYLQSGQPYGNVIGEMQTHGETSTNILNMIIDSSTSNSPMTFQPPVAQPGLPTEPGTLAAEQELTAMMEEYMERELYGDQPLWLGRTQAEIDMIGAETADRKPTREEAASLIVNYPIWKQGQQHQFFQKQYMDPAAAIARKGTIPLIKSVKSAVAEAVSPLPVWSHGGIEAALKELGSPQEQAELRSQLQLLSDAEMLPDPRLTEGEFGTTSYKMGYSEEFLEKLNFDPAYKSFLFLLNPEYSRKSRGEYGLEELPEYAFPKHAAEHPYDTAVGKMIGKMTEIFFIEELEHPEFWPVYAIGYGASKMLFGPGVAKFQAWQARKAAGVGKLAKVGKVAAKRRTMNILEWKIGKSFRAFLQSKYDTPGIKQLFTKDIELQATSMHHYLAGEWDEFLTANPHVASALVRMERESPGYFQKIIFEPLRQGGDDTVIQIGVPRFAKKVTKEVTEIPVTTRTAHDAALDLIGTKSEEAASIVKELGDRGLDTAVPRITDEIVEIKITNMSDDALREFLNDAPFPVSSRTAADGTREVVIDIPRKDAAFARRFIKDRPSYGKRVEDLVPPKEMRARLDSNDFRSLADDDTYNYIMQQVEDVPEPIVVGVPETPQRAAPVGDTGVAPPPAGAPGVTVPPAAPPIYTETVSGKPVWQVPQNEYILEKQLPRDLVRVQGRKARTGPLGFDGVSDKDVLDYIYELREVVEKYTPDNLNRFDQLLKKPVASMKAGDFDPFLQMSHKKLMGARFYKESQALGIDDITKVPPAYHEAAVREAVEHGETVPASVLVDYPDIKVPTVSAGPAQSIDDIVVPGEKYDPNAWVTPAKLGTPAALTNEQTEGLLSLGWTQSQVANMHEDELRRVLTQGIGPEHGRITKMGTVQPVTAGQGAPLTPADFSASILAAKIVDTVDDDTLMLLNSLYRTSSVSPGGLQAADVLATMRGKSKALDLILDLSKEVDSDALLDNVIKGWAAKLARPNYLEDASVKYARNEYRSAPQRWKDKWGKMRYRSKVEIPEIQDEALRAYMNKAMATENNPVKRAYYSLTQTVTDIADDISPDRSVRYLHPQFADDIRTKVIPVPERELAKGRLIKGTLFGNLTPAESRQARTIITLRDLLETGADDVSVPFTQQTLAAELNRQMAGATDRVLEKVARFDSYVLAQGQEMAIREKLRPSQLRTAYVRRWVREYTPGYAISGKYAPQPQKSATARFRGYLRGRKGTINDIIMTEDSIMMQFVTPAVDNELDDFALSVYRKYDAWDAIAKPGMTGDEVKAARGAIFGINEKTGRVIRPKPGRRYEIPGINEPYYGIQFERGNQWYQTEALNRSPFGNFVEDLLLIDPDAAERLASQIDMHDVARGIFPQELAEMMASAGDQGGALTRRVIAMGQANRSYIVPESIYNKMKWFKGQQVLNIPTLAQLNRVTSWWKRAVLGWAGVPFQAANLFGDALNLYRTAGFGAVNDIFPAIKITANATKLPGHEIRWLGNLTDLDQRVLNQTLDGDLLGSAFAHQFSQFQDKTWLDPLGVLRSYEKMGAFREGITRIAMRRYLQRQWDETGKIVVPGFTNRLYRNGKLLYTPDAAMNIVARNFTVDYASSGEPFNKIIRGAAFPFMKFYKDNGIEWARYYVDEPGEFFWKFQMPRIAARLWNNGMYPEAEAAVMGTSLGRRTHLILGQLNLSEDPKDVGRDTHFIVWSPQIPKEMATQWLGLDRLDTYISMVKRGWLTPKEAAKSMIVDMGMGPLRMGEQLMAPFAQAIVGILTNRDARTGMQVIKPYEQDLSELEKWNLKADYITNVMVTPMMQYAMSKEKVQYDMWDAVGVDVAKHGPVIEALAKGPFDIFRAFGLYLMPLDRAMINKRRIALDYTAQPEPRIKRRIYEYYTDWAAQYGYDGALNFRDVDRNLWVEETQGPAYDAFWNSPKMQRIVSDAALLGLNINQARIDQWLSVPAVQKAYYAKVAKTWPGEKKLAINSIMGLEKIKMMEIINKLPVSQRVIYLERMAKIEEMEKKKREGR